MQKPTILYLHGLGCTKLDFLSIKDFEELEFPKSKQNSRRLLDIYKKFNKFNLQGIDFPGHAGNEYARKLDVDGLVEIANKFIDDHQLGPVILVGHSLGGLVGLLLADQYPEKIQAFINIEGNLASEDCFFSRQVTQVDFKTFESETFPNFIKKLKSSDNRGFQKYAQILEQTQPGEAFYGYSPSLVEYSDNGNLLEKFIELEMPKLFIYGSENAKLSYLTELKRIEGFHCAEKSPSRKTLRVAEISNSNHFPQFDNPEDFYHVILDFLATIKA